MVKKFNFQIGFQHWLCRSSNWNSQLVLRHVTSHSASVCTQEIADVMELRRDPLQFLAYIIYKCFREWMLSGKHSYSFILTNSNEMRASISMLMIFVVLISCLSRHSWNLNLKRPQEIKQHIQIKNSYNCLRRPMPMPQIWNYFNCLLYERLKRLFHKTVVYIYLL